MLNFLRKSRKILGINARNLSYIRPSNPKRAIRIADNKLLTKRFLKEKRLPFPETFAVIKSRKELAQFDWSILPKSFVLKPNRGIGGEGILIVYGKRKQKKGEEPIWVKADRSKVTIDNLKEHVSNILDGNFSPNQIPDIAFFEERIKILKVFKPYSFRGSPDIRVIVYNLVPVMAELRIPTRESKGKSNLHLGGIGVGIDIKNGITTTAIRHDSLIRYVPGTKLRLSGIQIPNWKEVLELAVECQRVSKLGFMGIDIGIDREKGPMILELNARAGLSIQIANLAPLKERLERIKGIKIKSIERGVKLGRELFGKEMEEGLEEVSGRRVIGINEPIEIIDVQGNKYPTLAKVDSGAYRTTICNSLAKKLGLMKITGYKKVRGVLGKEERPIIDLSFILDKRLVKTEAFIADRREMKYDIIVGRRDLKRFLVDPAKNIFMGSRRKSK